MKLDVEEALMALACAVEVWRSWLSGETNSSPTDIECIAEMVESIENAWHALTERPFPFEISIGEARQ